MRSARLLVALVLLAASSAPAARAAGAADGHASGHFESGSSKLVVTDAYAFHDESALGGEHVIQVAVSNQGFVPAVIDEYWDRRYVLDHFFRDDETGLVYFEFSLDGAYRGLSYYFGPGDGCGYCSGGVDSTVKLVGGQLVGTLKQAAAGDDQRSFEISLNVPVASDDHGTPQGEGGGAPGRAYLAYHQALAANDQSAVRNLLAAERREPWAGAEQQGQGDSFFAFLLSEHPSQVRVTEAYVRGDRALVLLAGESNIGKIEGEALLGREQGEWRFEEETIRPILN